MMLQRDVLAAAHFSAQVPVFVSGPFKLSANQLSTSGYPQSWLTTKH